MIWIATKFNYLFIGLLPTFPENFMQIRLEVLPKIANRQTTMKATSLADVIRAKISHTAAATNKLCKHGSSVISKRNTNITVKIHIVVQQNSTNTTKSYRMSQNCDTLQVQLET